MKNIYFLCIVLIFAACQDSQEMNTPIIDPDNLLIGIWSNTSYGNNKITFERLASLPENAHAISFMKDGSCLERSSGWCGTPPLSFYDLNGTWQLDNSRLSISLSDSPYSRNWEIVELTEEKLVVTHHLSDQEEDQRVLMEMFEEISDLATSAACNDPSNWSFVAYGAKACGGPQGYIAYSNQINVQEFLSKVAIYTLAEHNYNIAWGVISTCDLIAQPIGVSCVNGSPVLNY